MASTPILHGCHRGLSTSITRFDACLVPFVVLFIYPHRSGYTLSPPVFSSLRSAVLPNILELAAPTPAPPSRAHLTGSSLLPGFLPQYSPVSASSAAVWASATTGVRRQRDPLARQSSSAACAAQLKRDRVGSRIEECLKHGE